MSVQCVFIVASWDCYQWFCHFVQIMFGWRRRSDCAASTQSCQHPHLIILHDLTCNSCLVFHFDLLLRTCSCHPTGQLPLLGIQSIKECAIVQYILVWISCKHVSQLCYLERKYFDKKITLLDHLLTIWFYLTAEITVVQQHDSTLNCIWQASCLIWTTRK